MQVGERESPPGSATGSGGSLTVVTAELMEDGYDIRIAQELLGQKDVAPQ
jgi:hypothetical protein